MSKIAFIINCLCGGGAERVCVALANGLAARGHQVDLVVLSLKGAIRDRELSSRVTLVDLDVGHARSSALALWRYLHIGRPTTVLSFNRQISVVLGLVRQLTYLRFRLVSRNIIFLSVAEARKKGVWHGVVSRYLVKKFYVLSDLLIAQSYAMKEDLVAYLGVLGDDVKVINNPVCNQIINFIKVNGLDFASKGDYLLCVGRLETQKAIHYSIRAFASIASDYPALRLKIVGTGSLEQELKKLARSLDVADRVDFEGYQLDTIPYYLYAKATILTSLYEGFPNVLIESIAMGTPVVAFDCPSGPREIVQDGVNGYLVPYLDNKALTVAISKVINVDWSRDCVVQTSFSFREDFILDQYEEILN